MEKLRIVFMGTPDFAVGILDSIHKSNHEIVGVITATDKPAGRGQKIKFSAVKEYALANNLPLLQPANLKDEDFLQTLKDLNANLQVVVAFRMLPKQVWEMPKFGTFNLHASLLPQYRGAAPINWAIINGETKTGVTTFFIDEKIDTGEMILRDEIEILDTDNVGTLHDKLMFLGQKTVLETLDLIESGKVTTEKQVDNTEIKTAYKLNKDNCKINWQLPGKQINNHIRGLCPYPAAWTHYKDNGQEWSVKLYETIFVAQSHQNPIGTVETTKKEMFIYVSDGYIQVLSLQFPGKKMMKTHELLNGISCSKEALFY